MKRNQRLIDANRYHDVLIEVFGLHSGETIPEGLQIAQSALDMQPTVEAVPHEEFLKLEYENMMLRRKLEKATAERDAAIRAIEHDCHTCGGYGKLCGECFLGSEWKWEGEKNE